MTEAGNASLAPDRPPEADGRLPRTIVACGALLSGAVLRRIAEGDSTLLGTAPADYGTVPDQSVHDDIVRSWHRLLGTWVLFRRVEARLPATNTTADEITQTRWLRPLFEELGFYGLEPVRSFTLLDGPDHPFSHEWGPSVPVNLLGWRFPLRQGQRGAVGAEVAPYDLMQEFLNRSDRPLWGIVTNGRVLRILRGSRTTLVHTGYCEVDLEAIFEGCLYDDFVGLWRLCHSSRFADAEPETCILERWNIEASAAQDRAHHRLRQARGNCHRSTRDRFPRAPRQPRSPTTTPHWTSVRPRVPAATAAPHVPDTAHPDGGSPHQRCRPRGGAAFQRRAEKP